MVIKPVFQKDLKPVFEEHGYELRVCERGLYIFESKDQKKKYLPQPSKYRSIRYPISRK